jgi:hypothetical protein
MSGFNASVRKYADRSDLRSSHGVSRLTANPAATQPMEAKMAPPTIANIVHYLKFSVTPHCVKSDLKPETAPF